MRNSFQQTLIKIVLFLDNISIIKLFYINLKMNNMFKYYTCHFIEGCTLIIIKNV